MPLYSDEIITLFFGDKQTALDPATFRGKTWNQVVKQEPFVQYQQMVGFHDLVLLHQTHGIVGEHATTTSNFPLFARDGDYLITTTPGLGIGVATADCLPIVVSVPGKKIAAVIHAGWRGLVGGIVQQVIARLKNEFQILPSELRVITGPGAQVCCYEVGQDFVDLYKDQKPFRQALCKNKDSWMFDAQAFLKTILVEKGILLSSIDTSYTVCTICEPLYCSYRREKKSPLRQLTIVSLK